MQVHPHLHLKKVPEEQMAWLIIDRQEKRNALTMEMRQVIGQVFRDLESDDSVRVVVIRGAGDKAFCSGGDIAQFLEVPPHAQADLHENMAAPERFSRPVIAAIDGYCLGAGFELALACDFRIATPRSQFALPEVRLGMLPGSGGSQRVIRLAGLAKAKSFLMTGRRIDAAEADRMGILSKVVQVDELEAEVMSLVRDLNECAPLSVRMLKRIMNRGENAPLDVALELEGQAYGLIRSTEDYQEGVRAFVEKRKPKYKGQ